MIKKLISKQAAKPRKTKIICTIGPATKSESIIKTLVDEGMDYARFNFSHGSREEFARWAKIIKKFEKKSKRKIDIIQDLQGPRVRIGKTAKDGQHILAGKKVSLYFGGEEGVRRGEIMIQSDIDLDIKKGNKILMDKGLVELDVRNVSWPRIECKALTSGMVFSGKGINLPDSDVKTPLTKKDLADLEAGLEMGADWVALSFVEDKQDVLRLRELAGRRAKIISKIERPQAIGNFQEILDVSDAVMIARGDLGIEIPYYKLPSIQKRAIRRALNSSKPSIVATDMLASMVIAKRPTRAEVLDVANAVLDGASAVMLSDETAIGKNPVESLVAMRKIVEEAEDFARRQELGSLL